MNTEYTKFNKARHEYNPPVNQPGHFSNLPEILVPTEHVERGVNPFELEDDELLKQSATPPPTPPELTPGRAGCNVFREGKVYYMDPCFQNPAYVQKFISKIVLIECSYHTLPFFLLLTCCFWRESEQYILKYEAWLYGLAATGFVGVGGYIYFIGLCRNPPFLQIAYVVRILLSLLVSGMTCLLIHLWFLKQYLGAEEVEHVIDSIDVDDLVTFKKEHSAHHHDDGESHLDDNHYDPKHSPPYMAVIIIMMLWIILGILSFFFARLGFNASDYRVPIFIYFICSLLSPILVTIVLSDKFGSKPLEYDLFQILFGGFVVNLVGISTQKNLERILEGKLCPIVEGEVLYPALHYGM